MPIKCHFETEQSLLIGTVTGDLTFDQVTDLQDDYFEKYIARNVILDLSLASLEKLKTRDVENIARMSDTKKDLRPANSKTAIIATSPVPYGLAMMYAIHSELRELTWELNVLNSMDEALEWIGPGDMTGPEGALPSGQAKKEID